MTNPSQARNIATAALRANPVAQFTAEHLAILDGQSGDVPFAEAGIDSMGLMELSIWLEVELALSITAGELARLHSLSGLEARIARHLRTGA